MNLNLELTDHCNLRCKMCSQSLRDEAHGAPMRFMDFETWRKSLLGLQTGGTSDIDLCPHWLGEPTLHPYFEQFLEYAFAINQNNRIFRTFKLHTNAVIFPVSRSACLLRLASRTDQAPDTFRAIHFSIDAFLPSTYQTVKGKDRRDMVFRNVEQFLELRARLNLTRPVAHIAFVVQDGNSDEVPAFFEHWRRRLGAHQETTDWPDLGSDALYLRRWNTQDQAHADRLHTEAARRVGLQAQARLPGSF